MSGKFRVFLGLTVVCGLVLQGLPVAASVTSPPRSLRALNGRQLWVPICSRRGVNGSAAFFDNTNTAAMDQVACVSPSYGTVTAIKLVYAAFDMPQQGEVDRSITASGVAGVIVPGVGSITLTVNAAAASGATTLSLLPTSLGANGVSVGQTVTSSVGLPSGTYVTAVNNSFVSGSGNTPATTIVTLSTATNATIQVGQAFTFSGSSVAAKFGGKRQFTIEPAHDVVTSDPISVQMAPSQPFFVRTAVSFSAPGLQLMDYPGFGSRLTGEFDNRGTSFNDQTLVPSVLGNTGGGYWCPVAVLALVTTTAGKVPPGAVLVLGDSIAAGTGDTADALGFQGYIQRSLENSVPFVTAARGSTTALGLAARGDGQYALSVDTGVTDVLLELGRNDIEALQQTDLQTKSVVQGLVGRYISAGKRVWCFTVPPTTQSNDGWTSLANQTWTVAAGTTSASVSAGVSTIGLQSAAGVVAGQAVAGTGIAPGSSVTSVSGTTITLSVPTASTVPSSTRLNFGSASASLAAAEGYRRAYNGFLRTNSAALGCAGLIDVDNVFADVGGSGKWRVDLGSASADGVHPSAALHQAVVSAGLISPSMFVAQ